MLIPATRPLALTVLLVCSAAAIAQTVDSVGNPYTATEKVTLIQKLADGTTISHVSTTIRARDSQGRTMQQTPMPGMLGRDNVTNTNVMDPVARTTTTWMSQSKQATRFHMPELHRAAQPSGSLGSGSLGSGSAMGSGPIVMGGISAGSGMGAGAGSSILIASGIGGAPIDPKLRPATQIDKLGSKAIAGVYAEGTRITTTYPVGYFGNDRPMVNVRETWTSPDLKLVVLTTDEDPRNGSRTTEITDLVRGEPDPALFQVPEGYTIKDQYPATNPASN
jgi:hypothetical protein